MSHDKAAARLTLPGLALTGLAALVFALGAVVVTYRTVPTHHGDNRTFDTLIVLGSPPDPDGMPSPEQRERVLEAVREWKAGRAGAIIVSGGETLPGLVEADSMQRVALEAGVPQDRVFRERQALNTLQNIFYSHRIMLEHGWTSAEVVSSPSHLPRASLILAHWDFRWKVQAAPWPASYTLRRIAPYYLYEALGTTALRWFGFRRSPFLPASPSDAAAISSGRSARSSSATLAVRPRHRSKIPDSSPPQRGLTESLQESNTGCRC